MRKTLRVVAAATALVLLAGCGTTTKSASTTTTPAPVAEVKKAESQKLTLYFPIAASGSQGLLISQMVIDFNAKNKGKIDVNAVFSGDYDTTMTKVQTAIAGGQSPDMAILLAADLFTLLDKKQLVAAEDLAKDDKDGADYLKDFYPGFLENSSTDGKIWSMPFQRSAPVLYYNKDMFAKSGFDHAPKNWDELVSMGTKLGKDNAGVTPYIVPTMGKTYWELVPFFLQNGKNVVDETGSKVFFNDPKNVEALQFFIDLGKKGITPKGVLSDWGPTPGDFSSGKAAMIMHSSGSLAGITKASTFKVGVAPLPAGPTGIYGTNTGGGNLYVFKTTPERQKAAWSFVRFMTDADNLAKWCAETGYIGPRKAAYEAAALKDIVAKDPNYGVLRDQLQSAHRELATHESAKVAKVLNDAMQAAILGQKSAKDALDGAQKDAEAILAPFVK